MYPLYEADANCFAVDSKQAACYKCVTMSKYISSTPDIIGGAPVIKGTRTPIEVILYRLKEGNSVEAIHTMYPWIDVHTLSGAIEETPFLRQIQRRLLENKNIKRFDDEGGFFLQLDDIYKKLSSFTHTKGARYSSRALSSSNFNTFNEKSLKYWVRSLQKVIRCHTDCCVPVYCIDVAKNILRNSCFGMPSCERPFRTENQVNASSESRLFLYSPTLLILIGKIPVRKQAVLRLSI